MVNTENTTLYLVKIKIEFNSGLWQINTIDLHCSICTR